ncbi:MAG: hypothetical protein AAGC81_04840 [Pseudomonadota bacterium]
MQFRSGGQVNMMEPRAVPAQMLRFRPYVARKILIDRKVGVNPEPGACCRGDCFSVGGPTADLLLLSNSIPRHEIAAVVSDSWTEVVDLATELHVEITDADTLMVPVR